MKKIDGHLKIILEKMCSVGGYDYETVDFTKKKWFNDYTWTQANSDKFRKWLLTYLVDNPQAQKELFEMTIATRRLLEKGIDVFMLNTSFRVEVI